MLLLLFREYFCYGCENVSQNRLIRNRFRDAKDTFRLVATYKLGWEAFGGDRFFSQDVKLSLPPGAPLAHSIRYCCVNIWGALCFFAFWGGCVWCHIPPGAHSCRQTGYSPGCLPGGRGPSPTQTALPSAPTSTCAVNSNTWVLALNRFGFSWMSKGTCTRWEPWESRPSRKRTTVRTLSPPESRPVTISSRYFPI